MLPRTLSTSVLTASTSALVLLLLTACGGEDTAAAAPASTADAGADASADTDTGESADEEESTEPIPASSEGPAQNWPEPEVPEEIYEDTEEGAEALLYYWWEVLDYSWATGDTELLESISSDECVFCENEIERTRYLFDERDGWWVSEDTKVRESFTRLDDDDLASSVFVLDAGAFDVYVEGEFDGAGEDPLTGITWQAWYSYQDGAWVVDELFVANSDQVERESDA